MNRESFLAKSGNFPVNEEVQTSDGPVLVKVLTAGEKDAFDNGYTEKRFGFRAGLVAFCAMDAAGSRIFDDEHMAMLNNMPFTELEPIIEAAIRVNKISKQDQEVLAKNSNGQSDGTSSG